jgi:hypothetical protein
MLSFYELDATNLIIILITAFIAYKIIDRNTENKNEIMTGFVSILIGFVISLLYSYVTLENDEVLTSNFWE